MKPDSNIETDRLLHRLARLSRDSSTRQSAQGGETSVSSVRAINDDAGHLDADELIAFAENVLPAATRERYTGHLAECDSCRKQVAELVLSSGVLATLETETVKETQVTTRSWGDWFSAMFAPPMIRYATSIVLIVGISAIAFMIFRGGSALRFSTTRTDSGNGSVSSSEPESTPATVGENQNQKSVNAARPNEGGDVPKSGTVAEDPGATRDEPQSSPVEVQKSQDEERAANPPPPATAGAISTEERSVQRDEDSKLDARQQPGNGEDTLNKNKQKKEADKAELAGRLARESESRADAAPAKDAGGAQIAASKTASVASEKPAARKRAKSNAEPSPSTPADSNTSDDRASQGVATGRSEASRTVSGRQFVRRDGTWVDVAYRSQATTNVKRGSDQYRALVADEPGLRAVANQLGGVVIVVWSGRAYRIY